MNLINNNFILAIHSTNDFFGFAYRFIRNEKEKVELFSKKFDKNLTNNLIYDLKEFLPNESFRSIDRISISLGPANFNASRLIVVLARTISQQINCSLDSCSSFKLMAKRIGIKNNLLEKNNNSFWITKKLKHRGYLCGLYKILCEKKGEIIAEEIIKPNLYKKLPHDNPCFEVDNNIKDDLIELLNLSLNNLDKSIHNKWEDVLPIYPLSPTN